MTDTDTEEQRAQSQWRRRNIIILLNRLGLSKDKTAKLGGRVNPQLLELARKRAGVETDSQLIELALGNLVLDDGFPEAFRAIKGTVSPDLDLEI